MSGGRKEEERSDGRKEEVSGLTARSWRKHGPGRRAVMPRNGHSCTNGVSERIAPIALLATALKSACKNTAFLSTRITAELPELLIPGGPE